MWMITESDTGGVLGAPSARWQSADCPSGNPLELESPKGSVRLNQLQADVPGLVIAPDYFGFGLAATFWMHQPDAAVKR
jgi:hypothetical protein